MARSAPWSDAEGRAEPEDHKSILDRESCEPSGTSKRSTEVVPLCGASHPGGRGLASPLNSPLCGTTTSADGSHRTLRRRPPLLCHSNAESFAKPQGLARMYQFPIGELPGTAFIELRTSDPSHPRLGRRRRDRTADRPRPGTGGIHTRVLATDDEPPWTPR